MDRISGCVGRGGAARRGLEAGALLHVSRERATRAQDTPSLQSRRWCRRFRCFLRRAHLAGRTAPKRVCAERLWHGPYVLRASGPLAEDSPFSSSCTLAFPCGSVADVRSAVGAWPTAAACNSLPSFRPVVSSNLNRNSAEPASAAATSRRSPAAARNQRPQHPTGMPPRCRDRNQRVSHRCLVAQVRAALRAAAPGIRTAKSARHAVPLGRGRPNTFQSRTTARPRLRARSGRPVTMVCR